MKFVSVLAAAIVVAAALPSMAATFRGEWNNVYQGGGGRVRFVGRLDPAAGVVRGRLRCRPGCPVRGRFRPACSNGECSGPVGPASAGCTASGSVYLQVFEGTWECGPGRGGILSFGTR